MTVLFTPFDTQTRRGSRPSDQEVAAFSDRHMLALVELNTMTNAYLFRTSGDRQATLREVRADAIVYRAEEIIVTDCAAQ